MINTDARMRKYSLENTERGSSPFDLVSLQDNESLCLDYWIILRPSSVTNILHAQIG